MSQLYPLQGRCQIKSQLCCLEDVSDVITSSKGDSIHVYSSTGAFMQVSPLQTEPSQIYPTSACSMTSTDAFWWTHMGDSDRLVICPAAKPTLIIGDSIRMHEAILEIHQVISVDALPQITSARTTPIVRFVILVEGLLLPGVTCGALWGVEAVSFDSYRDGDTEVHSPGGGSDGSTAQDSNDEEHDNNIPPVEMEKRYLAVFVVAFEDSAVVECACALKDNVIHDQTPTSIRFIAPSIAIVSGSNG
jgi:hypothetical protein